MSDHLPPTPSRGDDRMRDTLTALRVDADSCGLSDPASVRRRGQARTRHQALAGVCAAVVVVAVVVTGGAIAGGNRGAIQPMPATQSPSPSASTLRLASPALLRGGDVGAVGPYDRFRVSPSPVDEQQRPLQCIPSPTTLGAVEGQAALFYSDLDATFVEHVLRFADAPAAAEAVTELSAAFASCTKGKADEATVADRGPARANGAEGISETMNAARLTTPKAAGELAYYELGVARSSNVVVVLEWSSMGKPISDSAAWVLSTDLLDVAAHRATA
jgi:hypothetical protein